MRRSRALVLLATFSWIGGLGQDARAGVTVEVLFQDGTGTSLTIYAGDTAGGGSRVMDVILKSSWDMTFANMSVSYSSNNGLAVGSMYEWSGVEVGPGKYCAPMAGLFDTGLAIQSFDCSIPPPFDPPFLAAGVYTIGTIGWDTSGTTVGTEVIAADINDVINGVGVVINGNYVVLNSVDITQSSATLNIVAEATPVPSMRAAGVAVLGVAIFGIGVMGLIITARRRFD